MFVADKATKLAALRSAQIDVLGPLNFTDVGVTWEERDSLEKTNPDLKYKQFAMAGQSIVMRHGAEPFYPDIRVREALQMAINRDELAATWGGGVLNSLMDRQLRVLVLRAGVLHPVRRDAGAGPAGVSSTIRSGRANCWRKPAIPTGSRPAW